MSKALLQFCKHCIVGILTFNNSDCLRLFKTYTPSSMKRLNIFSHFPQHVSKFGSGWSIPRLFY